MSAIKKSDLLLAMISAFVALAAFWGGQFVLGFLVSLYAILLFAKQPMKIANLVVDVIIIVVATIFVGLALLTLDGGNTFLSAITGVLGLGGYGYVLWLRHSNDSRASS